MRWLYRPSAWMRIQARSSARLITRSSLFVICPETTVALSAKFNCAVVPVRTTSISAVGIFVLPEQPTCTLRQNTGNAGRQVYVCVWLSARTACGWQSAVTSRQRFNGILKYRIFIGVISIFALRHRSHGIGINRPYLNYGFQSKISIVRKLLIRSSNGLLFSQKKTGPKGSGEFNREVTEAFRRKYASDVVQITSRMFHPNKSITSFM